MGRRNVTKNILDQDVELKEGEVIARVIEPRGKNIHQVEFCDSDQLQEGQELKSTLCQLPPKFRNLVWIKRGSFVSIQLYDEKDGKNLSESKVGGTIEQVIFPYHIKRLKLKNQWPSWFGEENEEEETGSSEEDFVNPNYRRDYIEESSDEE